MRIPLPAVRRRARIEIIPLIDIVFFLLATFVMVSLSMVRNQGIPLRLPTAHTATPQPAGAQATISVTDDGAIFLNQAHVGFDELPVRLAALHAGDPRLRVFIHGAAEATFGQAIRVLDEVRRAGITDVAIRTAPMSQPEPLP